MKIKLLIVEDDEEVRNILTMHIESEFNAELLFADSIANAIDLLKKDKKIPMVIAKYNFKGARSSKIFKHIKDVNLECCFILLTSEYPKSDQWLKGFMVGGQKYKYLKEPVNEEEFVQTISCMLQLKRPSQVEGYRRIMKNNISMFSKEKIDIFTMNSKQEYEKIEDVSKLENVDDERDFYYVDLKDYVGLSVKINKMLSSKLKSNILSSGEKLAVQVNSIKKVHDSLKDLGLSSQEIALGQELYSSTLGQLQKSKRLSSLLGRMIKYKAFTHELALMCNYLTVAIVSKTSWYSDHSMKKLSLAALLQDISLQEDGYAKISEIDGPEFMELEGPVQKLILDHPLNSVKIVEQVKGIGDVSNNIKDIILSHHERPHGTGYPRKLEVSALSGLSCVFIIAHEFARNILDKEVTIDRLQLLQVNLEENYSHGRFRRPYEAFVEVFKNGIGKI